MGGSETLEELLPYVLRGIVPLYTLLLEQWVLLPKSTPAALAKLQRQKEKDEEAFLERKRKR